MDIVREKGAHILGILLHCTYRLQTLCGFFGAYQLTIHKQNWLKTHSGRAVTQFQNAKLVDNAFQKTATISTGFSTFRAT